MKTLKGKEALEAVKRDGMTLQFIKEQTPEICLEAVKRDERALAYVKEQTPEICITAVQNTLDAIVFVEKEFLKDVNYYGIFN